MVGSVIQILNVFGETGKDLVDLYLFHGSSLGAARMGLFGLIHGILTKEVAGGPIRAIAFICSRSLAWTRQV